MRSQRPRRSSEERGVGKETGDETSRFAGGGRTRAGSSRAGDAGTEEFWSGTLRRPEGESQTEWKREGEGRDGVERVGGGRGGRRRGKGEREDTDE